MHVCVVGSGNQGTGFAALLAKQNDIESVLLLDYDAARAARAVELVEPLCPTRSGRRLASAQGDACDSESIAARIESCDLLLNATLPAFNVALMRACLVAGVHYIDLYSHSSGTPGVPFDESVDAQLALDEEFRAAGLLAIPSVGIAPGWVNLAAQSLIGAFDEVESVILRDIDWTDGDLLLAPATPEVVMEQWFGAPGTVYTEDGQTVSCDLLEGEECYDFPPPVGAQTVLRTTSNACCQQIAAAAQLPIHRMEEKFAIVSGGLGLKDTLLTAVCRQTAKHKGADNMLALFGSSLVPTSDLHVGEACKQGLIRDAAFVSTVEVTGTQAGERACRTLQCVATLEQTLMRMPWAPPGVLATVALPAELALMITRGEIAERGVLQLAELAAREAVLKRVEEHGLEIVGSADDAGR